MTIARFSDVVRRCERVTVTKVVVVEGSGHSAGDPVREVTYYFEDDGGQIARYDSLQELNLPRETIPG